MIAVKNMDDSGLLWGLTFLTFFLYINAIRANALLISVIKMWSKYLIESPLKIINYAIVTRID